MKTWWDLSGKVAVELEDGIVSDDPEFPANATESRRLETAGAIGVIVTLLVAVVQRMKWL